MKKSKDKKKKKLPKNGIWLPFVNQGDISKDYLIKDTIGSGSFGKVKKAIQKNSGRFVAIKVISKNHEDLNPDSLQNEVSILTKISHKGIVELIDVYEGPKKLYLVMEILDGGELFDLIKEKYPNGFPEDKAALVFKGLVSSIKYLHSKSIAHRDLKPENILLTSKKDDTNVKITDFGLAKMKTSDGNLKTALGTPNYVAPEVLLNRGSGYDCQVDMWSLGVILYILLCGFPPFFSDNVPELYQQICDGQYGFPSPYWDFISASARDLITKLLQVEPKKRYLPERTLKHPWIKYNTLQTPFLENKSDNVFKKMREFDSGNKFKMTVEALLFLRRIGIKMPKSKKVIKKKIQTEKTTKQS